MSGLWIANETNKLNIIEQYFERIQYVVVVVAAAAAPVAAAAPPAAAVVAAPVVSYHGVMDSIILYSQRKNSVSFPS